MNTTHRATVSPVDEAPMADSIQEIIVFVDGGPRLRASWSSLAYSRRIRRAPHRRIHAAGACGYPPEMFARGEGIPKRDRGPPSRSRGDRGEITAPGSTASCVVTPSGGSGDRSRTSAATWPCTRATRTWWWLPARTRGPVRRPSRPRRVPRLTSGRPVIVLPPRSTASGLRRILGRVGRRARIRPGRGGRPAVAREGRGG